MADVPVRTIDLTDFVMDMDIASMYPSTIIGLDTATTPPESFSVSSRGRWNDNGAIEWMEWSMVNPCAEISMNYDRGLCQIGRPVDHFEAEEDLFKI